MVFQVGNDSVNSNFDSRLVITVTNGFGGLLLSFILVVLVCTKSYKTFLQRLFMWIILNIAIVDFCQAASMIYQYNGVDPYARNSTSTQDVMCECLAFFSLWSYWSDYIFCSILYLYFLLIVYRQTRHDSTIVVKLRHSRRFRVLLELSIVVGTLLFPVSVLWVPIYTDVYGFNGLLCRFRPNTSRYYDFLVYTLAELAGIVAVTSSIGIAIVYCMLPKTMHNARRAVKNLLIVLLVLVVYKILLTLIKVISIALKIENSLVDVALSHCFRTLVVSAVVIIYLFAFHFSQFCEPVMKLTKMEARKNEMNQRHYGQYRKIDYKTFKDSSRESAPSSTYFNVPYTGQFTNISKV